MNTITGTINDKFYILLVKNEKLKILVNNNFIDFVEGANYDIFEAKFDNKKVHFFSDNKYLNITKNKISTSDTVVTYQILYYNLLENNKLYSDAFFTLTNTITNEKFKKLYLIPKQWWYYNKNNELIMESNINNYGNIIKSINAGWSNREFASNKFNINYSTTKLCSYNILSKCEGDNECIFDQKNEIFKCKTNDIIYNIIAMLIIFSILLIYSVFFYLIFRCSYINFKTCIN